MINIKKFFLIILAFYFLPAMGFVVGKHIRMFPIYILVPIALTILFLIKKDEILNIFHRLFKQTPFKYLVFMYIWLLISGICAILHGYMPAFRFLFVGVISFIIRYFSILILPIIIIPKYIGYKQIIKIIYTAYLAIFIFAIIEAIGYNCNISVIQAICGIVSNIQYDLDANIIDINSGIHKVRSVMVEAGDLGKFIVYSLPIIYELSLSKYKIFNLKYLNKIAKISLIPLSFISLFLTQSPINLLFAIIVSFVYFVLKSNKKRRIIVISTVSICFGLIILIFNSNILNIDISRTFLNRILIFMDIDNYSFEKLVYIEPSLASRIICFVNEFCVFLQHPITGIGFGNIGHIVIKQFENSPVPLTYEVWTNLQNTAHFGGMKANTNIFYTLLSKTGLLGCIFYFTFGFKLVYELKKISQYFHGILKHFVWGLHLSLGTILTLYILYSTDVYAPYDLLLFGISLSLILYIKTLKRRNDNEAKKL